MSDVTLPKDLNLQESFGSPDPDVWMKLTEKVLNGAPFQKKVVTRTPEGINLQPVYDRTEIEKSPVADTTPGEAPFIRGTKASGYKACAWDVCQGLPYPDPKQFNEALCEDIARGQTAALLTLDANGRRGCDPVDTAGRCGTSVVSAADLEVALKGVDLRETPLYVEAGASAPVVAAALSHSSVTPSAGSVCFDPLSILALDGELPMTMNGAWDLLAKHVVWTDRNLPGLRSLGVDVSWNVNAGGNAVYDLALMLASAAESFRALEERGVSVDLAAANAQVSFSIGADFFMEIAKFRAARGLWCHLVESCGGGDEAKKLRQVAATSIWNQTRLDPYVNLLRATSQSFSAVMGGVDGLRVAPFDAPFGLPNTFSRRIARNIQLVLREEAHLTEVVDPAGGSWTVEHLTNELSARAWKQFQDIEAAGGLSATLRDGSLRETLASQATARRLRLAQRREVMVGSNQFANLEENIPEAGQVDYAAVGTAAAARIASLNESRDNAAVTVALDALKQHMDMNSVEAALKHGATFGEVMSILSGGDSARVTPVETGRLTSEYEALRDHMADYVAERGAAPKILMAQMGPVKQHKVRSDFSQAFLKPGGFDLDADRTFATVEEAAEAAADDQIAATVLCSTDDTYPELAPAFAKAVKAASPDTTVILAGLLPDQTEAFKEAGVDAFIHLKANNLELLQDLQVRTGVTP